MTRYSSFRAALAAIALLAGVLFAAMVPAKDTTPQPQYENLLTPILAAGETVIGQTIDYPDGVPKVTAAIVTIPPGGSTGLHTHPVPLFAYVLDGTLTVDYGDKGKRSYRTGEGVLEAIDWPHNGVNEGAGPVRLLAVYVGAEGVPNAESVAPP